MKLGIRQGEADGRGKYAEVDGIPVDGITGLQTRLSMQARRSEDGSLGHSRANSWSLRSPITGVPRRSQDLIHSYDVEAHNLGDLAEDSEESETGMNYNGDKRKSRHLGGKQNGSAESSNQRRIGGNAQATKSFERLHR